MISIQLNHFIQKDSLSDLFVESMKTLAQRSVAAVRKANKQWRISLCSGAMMELIRCMELNNSNVSACRGPIEAMSQCIAGKKVLLFCFGNYS